MYEPISAVGMITKSDVPIVLLEAWRSSRPVWVSDLPPLRELTEGLVEALPYEPAAWAAAARRIPAEGEALGAAGRARLLTHYTARHVAAAYEALYDELEAGLRVRGAR